MLRCGMATIEKPTDDLLNSLAYVLAKNPPVAKAGGKAEAWSGR